MTSRWAVRVSAAALLAILALVASCPARPDASVAAEPASNGASAPAQAPRPPTIDERFRSAADARRQGTPAGRARAAALYRGLSREAEDPSRAAEAAFRLGEVERARERFDDAAQAFAEVEMLDPNGPWGRRAGLERAHVARRAGRPDDALELYARVFGDVGHGARQRDEAGYWAGRVELERGDESGARLWFEQVAERAEDPVLRLRAYDQWMLGYLRSGDLEAAAGVLARARVGLAERVCELTENGARARRALERMRGPKELERATRERHRSR